MLDLIRLPFPDSEDFSWSSHFSKSVTGYWMVFPAGGATMIDSFERVYYGGNNNINRWLT